jgi:iduronate 2-sulfatase
MAKGTASCATSFAVLWWALIALVSSAASSVGADNVELPSSSSKKLNVLFVIADDLKAELGIYGSKSVLTPNLDKLGKEGAIFSYAYSQISNCSPSRTSVLTGTRPDINKVFDLKKHFRKTLPNVVTLPQHFKNNGYFTKGIGKVYHGGVDDRMSWSVPWYEPDVPMYANAELAIKNSGYIKKHPVRNISAWECGDVDDDYYLDGQSTNLAIDTLTALTNGTLPQPFFLAVGYHKPHLPFVSPKKYCEFYNFSDMGRPVESKILFGSVLGDAPMLELEAFQGVPSRPHFINEHNARLLKRAYFACISYVDSLIGRVLATLDSTGLRKNTIVVLWGDHGYTLGDHGHWGKHTNYEGDVRVPLFFSGPGISEGLVVDNLAELLDIYPTLCELTGVPAVPSAAGKSLVSLLHNNSRFFQEPRYNVALSQYPRQGCIMGYSMRSRKFRLTIWFQLPNERLLDFELYKLEASLTEKENIGFNNQSFSVLLSLIPLWNALAYLPKVNPTDLVSRVQNIRMTENLLDYCVDYFVPK